MASPDPPSSEPTPAATPPPGERRLARPPSERYAPAPDDVAGAGPSGSPARAVGGGLLVAAVGALAIVVLGGVLAMSAGLLVVAGVIGWAAGVVVRLGAGDRLSVGPRRTVAVVAALVAVSVGQVGLWWYAGTEGGVLPIVDYLGQTFGILVPLQALAAALVAWVAAR